MSGVTKNGWEVSRELVAIQTQYEAYRDLAYFLGVTKVNPLIQSWKAEVEREREQARRVVDGYRGR